MAEVVAIKIKGEHNDSEILIANREERLPSASSVLAERWGETVAVYSLKQTGEALHTQSCR